MGIISGKQTMTRDELIVLAVSCHWHLTASTWLRRGLVDIYPGDDPDPTRWKEGHITDEKAMLWDGRQQFPAKHVGSCQLSDLHFRRHPWIIGPFSGKFFSLKTQRLW